MLTVDEVTASHELEDVIDPGPGEAGGGDQVRGQGEVAWSEILCSRESTCWRQLWSEASCAMVMASLMADMASSLWLILTWRDSALQT